jgi:dipeptidase E
MKILAIGGGSVGLGETRPLDVCLIEMSAVLNPRVVFIPTASSDDPNYELEFTRAYERLGCSVQSLRLHYGENPRKIEDADIVYVGGGNTKMMLEVWRESGVDILLRKHVDSGKPVGGLSAGALCWFRVGNSDWPQYEGIEGVNTDRLDCLGWVDLVLCPHTKQEGFRLAEFREMMKNERGAGIGLDDNCAIQILGENYRIVASNSESVARRIEWIDGQISETILEPHEDFRPLRTLLKTA